MHGWLSTQTRATPLQWASCAERVNCGILLALPVSVAFGSLAAWQVHGINVTATDALIGLLVVFAPISVAKMREPLRGRIRWIASYSPYLMLCAALITLMLLMALSLLWAADRALALKEVLKWGEALVVLAVAPRMLRRPGMVAAILAMVLAVAVAEACLGGLQATIFVGTQHVAADRGVRVVGTFGQPNPYAGALNLVLPLALALLGWARGTTRWLLAAASMALLAAMLLAQSRGALLGLCGAVMGMAWLGWPPLRRWLAAGATVAMATVTTLVATGRLTLAGLLARLGWRPLTDAALSTNITDANFSTVERLAHWAAAWRMFLAHPLTGVGAGNYAIAYATYAVPRWPLPLGHAHNLFLHMLAELGLGGLLCYLAILAASGWALWRAWLQSAHRERQGEVNASSPLMRMLMLGLLGVQIAMSIHNGFDDLTTHSLLVEWTLLLACSQTLPLDRLINEHLPETER
jgi:O-antigen ligase